MPNVIEEVLFYVFKRCDGLKKDGVTVFVLFYFSRFGAVLCTLW